MNVIHLSLIKNKNIRDYKMSELTARIIKENKKHCAEGKIVNPATKRCVDVNGPTGMKVIEALKKEWEKKGSSDTSSDSSVEEKKAKKPKKVKPKKETTSSSSSSTKEKAPKKAKPSPAKPAPVAPSSVEEFDAVFKEALDSQPEDDGPNPFDDDMPSPPKKVEKVERKPKKSSLAIVPAPTRLGDCAKAGQLRNIAIDERGGSNRCANFENIWDKIKAVIDDNLDISISQLEKMFGGKFTDENKKAIKKYMKSKGGSSEEAGSPEVKPKKSKKEPKPAEEAKPVEKPKKTEPKPIEVEKAEKPAEDAKPVETLPSTPPLPESELDEIAELVYAQFPPHRWIKVKKFKKFLKKNINIYAGNTRALTRLQSPLTFIDLTLLSAPCSIESYGTNDYKYMGVGKVNGKWTVILNEDVADAMYLEQEERGRKEYKQLETEQLDLEDACDLNSECADGRLCNLDLKKCVDSAGSDMEVTVINGNKVVGSKENIRRLKALMDGSAEYVFAQKTLGAISRDEMIAFLKSKKPGVDYASKSDAELGELIETLVKPKVEDDIEAMLEDLLNKTVPSAVLVDIENGKAKDGLDVIVEEDSSSSSSSSSVAGSSPVRSSRSSKKAVPRPIAVINPTVELPIRAPTPPSPVLSSKSVSPTKSVKPVPQPVSPARSVSISPVRSDTSDRKSSRSNPVANDTLSDTDSTASLPEPGASKADINAIRACLLGKR